MEQSKSHQHAVDISQWTQIVRERFEDFSQRMDKFERTLQTMLGKPDVCFFGMHIY